MAFAPDRARAVAETLLESPDKALLGEAVSILGSSKPGAKVVGDAFVGGKLPKEFLPRVADAVRNHVADPAYAALYDRVMRGGLTLTGADVEKLKQQVLLKGNATRGKDLYLTSVSLACVTCHRLEGVGGQIGPDLTRLWDTTTVEKLLETILEPSKEIKEGYQAYKATTLSGGTFTGLKISESASDVVLREATGRDVRIAKSDLDQLTPSKLSLMPDNVVSQLSYDQLLDLVAFLRSKREQESLRGIVREFTLSSPESKGEGVMKSVGPGGLFDWKSAPAGMGVATTYVWSAADQPGTLAVTTDDGVVVTVNGTTVLTRPAAKAGGFVEGETPTVTWKAGWNAVVVKLLAPGAVNRLTLKAGGEGLRTAAKPEK